MKIIIIFFKKSTKMEAMQEFTISQIKEQNNHITGHRLNEAK